ncbi:MAG: tRNA pseudouridine(55) synthase TruB [Bacilli bacterium]|nr:tRNA pseudouridine(55) synthase TruB [Bacilli bacterium]
MGTLSGILVVDKPKGLTSHQVVARIRKASGMKRVGHTGTLDPDVSGVLPICMGTATRLSEYLLDQQKAYIGTIRFGWSTTTQDASGETVEAAGPDMQWKKRLTRGAVEHALARFIGTQQQIPPAFSAIKIAGKRSYELARRGEQISIPARTVHFYELVLAEWHPDRDYPEAVFQVTCSKGTYIRTLCHNIGEALDVPAHMAALIRISSGPFTLQQAHSLEEIERFALENRLAELVLPPGAAIPRMSAVLINPVELSAVMDGKALRLQETRLDRSPAHDNQQQADRELVKLVDAENILHAIYQVDSSSSADGELLIRPVKVFKE